MRRTLNTEEHPFAEFFGKLVSPFDPSDPREQPATMEGEFSIHGVTRPVRIDGTLQKTEEGLQVEASWTINIEEYDIGPPDILFYRVDEEQDIVIKAVQTPTEAENTN